jgi:hypothetical protein
MPGGSARLLYGSGRELNHLVARLDHHHIDYRRMEAG